MTDVLFVSGEPLWPSTHGGRIRAARIVEQLARKLEVRVVAPVEGDPPQDVAVDPLPPPTPAGPWTLRPRLGHALLGPQRRAAVTRAVERRRPRFVMFAHSYLAAMAPDVGVPIVVDFADVEVRRRASLARFGAPRSRAANVVEAIKARRWEPRVARRAHQCTAASESDWATLARWGARAGLVPNGADPYEPYPSPAEGPVTFFASFGYPPNDQAAAFLVNEVWPLVRAAEPAIRLRLVGRHAPADAGLGAETVADPVDVDSFYRQASLVLAPVRAGGGSQLKVTEALGRRRLVVATPYSARSAPAAATAGVVVADGAAEFTVAILRLWRDRDARWERERQLSARPVIPTWEDVCAPLVEALAR